MLMSVDSGNTPVLILPDLSAAFNTFDHAILLDTLRNWICPQGLFWDCFSSHFSERVFMATIDNCTSSTALMSCGVPQGSVPGPILFSLYLLPLGHVIHKCTYVLYHCYANDSQIYFSFNPGRHSNLDSLHCCHAAIKNWMSSNLLQLDSDNI